MVRQLMIIAELQEWSLDDERRTIRGRIHKPKNSDFKEGEDYLILNFKNISLIPLFENGEGNYYLVQTQLGNYFKLPVSEMT